MRNTITLNGIENTEIDGLLIQSLPPISKPLMRTEIEEIDGRDGDIITPLGFSAYDKEITIGLYGDFDIDDVIQYFTSEGTVTFSNEPDKYYNYQIINQIDFERLLRYRTATVTLHVQPFKYSTDETPKTIDVEALETTSANITNSGNYFSRPQITLYGSGTVNLSLNGNQIFVINMGTTATNITIDTAAMEAYQGTTATLMNRSVDGDYNNFKLNIGKNTISWSGSLTKIIINNYSRWI